MLARAGLAIGAGALEASILSGCATSPRPAAARTVRAIPLGEPVQIASIQPRTCGSVMQQLELTSTDELFMTQSRDGSAPGRYTTVITRAQGPSISATDNVELDAMTILDGGHGLGLHIELDGTGRRIVWTSLQGAVLQSDPHGGRLARFAYTPGVYAIDEIPDGVLYLPQFRNAYGELQESIYNFDQAKGVAVERMYDFHTNRQERFTRRRISDILLGVDRPYGRMTLPVNPPTLQGFTTMDDTFFRWVGDSNAASGTFLTTDPMALERYDWRTGRATGTTTFPTLGQGSDGTWRDGSYEPEGCSVSRAPDGLPSLLVGVTVGRSGDHQWPVFRFGSIGAG